MGAYINSDKMSKEQWLAENATEVSYGDFTWKDTPKGGLPVVLVSNGFFTAAAVCYCEGEFNVFTDPNERRPRRFFYAKEADLHLVAPGLAEYIEKAQ